MQHRNVHLQNLRRMTEFCENQVECRRTSLLEYFGEHFSSEQCLGTCDNCKNKALGISFEKSDVTEDCIALAQISKCNASEAWGGVLLLIHLHLSQKPAGIWRSCNARADGSNFPRLGYQR
jgi:superfamily II DNA helicase RecQ